MTAGLINLSSKVPGPAVALIVAVVVVLGAAASAWADGSEVTKVSVVFGGHERGYAEFHARGDWLVVCDAEKDNLPVAVRYSYIRKDGTTQRDTHWRTSGVGSGLVGCSQFNHNFGERRTVWFQAGVRHRGGSVTWSKTEKTDA